ncbi:EAL domain-containing protein [Thiobacillus sp.]|uniref:EAL domain-containing protein n=1 Tax=Thiobacillus sp. TaxID=924 RepID=UPI0025CBE150|nr:EAL domain-containing protein [Thiobacillus sp.]MBT9540477.1 EAL domain-containing protein [Thiobacillus sp.]
MSVHGGLPARITGIVFWGMVLAGLLIVLVTIQAWEADLEDAQSAYLAEAALTLQAQLESRPEPRPAGGAKPPAILEQMRRRYGFSALEVAGPAGVWRAGKPDMAQATYMQAMPVHKPDGTYEILRMQAYVPAHSVFLSEQRKHVLLFTGLVAMVFGLILQAILHRMLSRPFLRMVGTAQNFAAGDKSARFDVQGADEFGFLAGFINQALDAANRSEMALSQEKNRVEVMLHSITDAVIATDADGCVQFMNPVAEELIACSILAARDRPLHELGKFIDELTRLAIADPVRCCLLDGQIVVLHSGSELFVNHIGAEIPVSGTAAPMRNGRGEIMGCVVALQDARHARELTRRLTVQASRDSLTGLFNRHSFESQVRRLIDEVDGGYANHALFYLDLDQFKIVNDTCGHVAGDELLRQLGVILRDDLRSDDILARLGGDEFGVLLRRCSLDQAIKIADKLRRSVEEFRFAWGDKVFQIGVSIGVVPVEPGVTDLAALLSAADLACYAAKEAGRNRVHVYEASDDALAHQYGEMHWATDLVRALDEDRFEIFVQPIVALAAGDSHRHWEVLLRLRAADGGYIGPGAFMSAAERYGLMPRIDRWVIERTFRTFSDIAARSATECCQDVVAINLSGASLNDSSLIEFVRDIQASTGMPWERVCFEITETVAIRNLHMAISLVNELRNMGCKFALDDFGSGLSSFAYLKSLPVDYLKIDGSFIMDIVSDPVDRAMVEAIREVSRIMGVKTVAEWVENEETAEVLRTIGIDYAQGYFFGRPGAVGNWSEKCEALSRAPQLALAQVQ